MHSDHLGTPRLLTNASQKAVWAWQGEPFGADQANEDPESTGTKYSFNLRFPGQYYDVETGNHYNLNRDYDPKVGRYVQSDPIGLAGGINTYAYVGGNPLSGIDPLGLMDMGHLPPPPGLPKEQNTCSRDWSNYWSDYANFVDTYAINVGPYAAAMAGGLMPKRWAPATGFRGPLLGSSNPLTSIPRGLGVPGMGGVIPRLGTAAIGLATIGAGMYDATIELEGLLYAIPSRDSNSSCSCSK
ncbi:RHS repeat-associated core domain-containing protein [Chitinimonas naiadis]